MKPTAKDSTPRITPSMNILDVLVLDRRTEAVFRDYGDRTGACLCCEALFTPLESVASNYGIDLDALLRDLEACASTPPDQSGAGPASG